MISQKTLLFKNVAPVDLNPINKRIKELVTPNKCINKSISNAIAVAI